MTISIIVPIYNIEPYLEKCITSIIEQSYENLQIILVDDGSSDASGRIADTYAKKDSRIQVIHKRNGGLVSARKAGLLVADGKYICFVDGDDWIEIDTIESMVNYLGQEDYVDMVLCGYKEDVGSTVYNRVNKAAVGIYSGDRLKKEIYRQPLCLGEFYEINIQPYLWNKLIKRTLATEHILPMDERICIGEDVAAILPLLLSAKKIIITDICKYHYCTRVSSMMRTKESLVKEKERIQILHQYLCKKKWMYGKGLEELQLLKFSMNNILTRIYPLVSTGNSNTDLWPFEGIQGQRSFVVYGAGSFGRAVYTYLSEHTTMNVVLWLDQKFQEYRDIKLPVDNPELVMEYMQYDILIAVLEMKSADAIMNFLLSKGFFRNKIHRISISEGQIREVLKKLQFE